MLCYVMLCYVMFYSFDTISVLHSYIILHYNVMLCYFYFML
jgi:hypothetical protein